MNRELGIKGAAHASQPAPDLAGHGGQYGRDDLEKVVPLADKVNIGRYWDDVPAAIAGMNRVLTVIRAEHPCQTEAQLTHAVWLSNEAYREFCNNDGDVKKTIAYVRNNFGEDPCETLPSPGT